VLDAVDAAGHPLDAGRAAAELAGAREGYGRAGAAGRLRVVRSASPAAARDELARWLRAGAPEPSTVPDTATIWPGAEWERATPEEMGMDRALLEQARDYALTAKGSGYVVHRGKLVMSWGDPDERYDLKSATKSFGSVALMLGLADGRVRLDEPLEQCRPGIAEDIEGSPPRKWIDEITLYRLATHSAGFSKRGGFGSLMYEPGTAWAYSDSGPNWLAECLTLAFGRDLRDVMFDRVFTPIGIGPEDLTWRENSYRPHEIDGIARREFGAGIHANVDAMARFGYLLLHDGRWRDRQLLRPELIHRFTRAQPALAELHVFDAGGEAGYEQEGAQRGYGVLWWTNADESMEGVPLDTYVAWGLYEGLVIVIPSMDLVIARAGPKLSWARTPGEPQGRVLVPFIGPIVQSIREGRGAGADSASAAAPYPPSPAIRGLEWAPADSIVRLAKGSDNWPTTWGDDGAVYTAYGDGWGFEPRVPEKLSLGFARVEGAPPAVRGVNLHSPTGEQRGGGAAGRKASGLLMVDGTLYLWARNAGNSQLAWSKDHGRSWTWADWRFTTSFGAPVFLEFGKDYAGARDGYVYVYSHDSDSAYEPADRMVLARVPKDRIAERAAYEFFVRLGERGAPVWSRDIEQRGAVFRNPGRAYRSGISYSPGLRRYLWYQVLPDTAAAAAGKDPDTRYEGGMAVFDAPEPWGPWTTAYYTEHWDVGPGESGNFPTAWMSPDGSTLWLVFSGDDHFSVRKARVVR
jgi:CubicO group peptidase (beta-lactamase class C family)